MRTVAGNIDEYIAGFPDEIKARLNSIRNTVRLAAPGAEERISYGMPAFAQNGMLVYFAAFKNHIGFFPGASGVAAFQQLLAGYNTSKGTIHFPIEKPVPLQLIHEIVCFRVEENLQRLLAKKKK